MPEPSPPKSWMLLAGVCCAVVLTAALLLFDWNSSPESESFVKNVPFLIWAVLLCSQTALWTLLAIPLWRSLRGLVADYRFDRGIAARLAISVAVVAFLVAVFVGFSVPVVPDYPFAHHRAKILTLTAGGFLVALVAMIGIWLVEAASTQLLLAPRERQLPEYLRLRADLRRFLGAAAAIIGAATLSTGGLRSAILSNVKGVEFPAEYVLYYGAYCSPTPRHISPSATSAAICSSRSFLSPATLQTRGPTGTQTGRRSKGCLSSTWRPARPFKADLRSRPPSSAAQSECCSERAAEPQR